MLVSTKTNNILKNFYGINQGLVLRKGTKQSTISQDEDILAEANFDEEIPTELGIYDLQRFIGNLSNLTDPKLDFEKNVIKISDKDTTISYYSCKPELLTTPPEDIEFDLSNPTLEFTLDSATLSKAFKIASINGSNRIVFERKDNVLSMSVLNSKDNTANKANIRIAENTGDAQSFTYNVETISKIMLIDYNVKIQDDIAFFEAKDGTIQYYISRTED